MKPAGRPPADPMRVAGEPLAVYLVEDSPLIRENLIATLEEMAPVAVVGTADNEGAATSWLRTPENRCELVIIDIFLKGGSGLGVLRSVTDHLHDRKLVVLSNYATPEMRQRCIELGADEVFDKSDEIDALLAYCADVAGGEPPAPTGGRLSS